MTVWERLEKKHKQALYITLDSFSLSFHCVAQTQLAPHLSMPGATLIQSGCEKQWFIIYGSLFEDTSMENSALMCIAVSTGSEPESILLDF